MKNLNTTDANNKKTIKKVTTEVVKFVQFLEGVRNLTNENAHTRARIVIADYFGYMKFHHIFTKIQEMQDIEGHLPEGLGLYRDEKANEMLAVIGVEYGEYVRKIIWEIGL